MPIRVAHGVAGKGVSGCQDNGLGHAGASELIRIYRNISTSELEHGVTILPLYSIYKLLQLHGAMLVILCNGSLSHCPPKTYVFVGSDPPTEQYRVYAFADEKSEVFWKGTAALSLSSRDTIAMANGL